MVGRELAALLGLAEAAAAGGEHDGRRRSISCSPHARAPAVLASARARRAATSGSVGAVDASTRVAERRRDRVPGAVADLEQPLARRAAAAGEPVAAVLARELDAELLEPVDGAGRLGGEHLDEPPVGGLVRALPDVLGVLLGRVVLAERGLDPALRLRRVARLERALRRRARRGRRRARRTRRRRGPEAPLPTTSTSNGQPAARPDYTSVPFISAISDANPYSSAMTRSGR